MEGMTIQRALEKNGCNPIGAQTVPNTFTSIDARSLLAEQVNNRSSAQWKKANFIMCSKHRSHSLAACLEGWKLLAEKEENQVLFLQGDDGVYRAYNWRGNEIHGRVEEIIDKYKIIK
ncbi:MAG: hypothetical protein IKJ78_09625 [Bacteroidales bacterium]|nr:hypothetical protein [Bacteroidales bacterium]